MKGSSLYATASRAFKDCLVRFCAEIDAKRERFTHFHLREMCSKSMFRKIFVKL